MTLTIYEGKDFARQFRVVRNNTLQIAQDIPESKYGFVPAPGCRAIGALLTHIAVSPQMWYEVHGRQRVKTLVGFDFARLGTEVKAEEVRSRTKAEILDLLRDEGDQFAAWLETLTPEALGVDVAPRLKTLKVQEPPKRSAGKLVKSVQELVEKLRNEAKVI